MLAGMAGEVAALANSIVAALQACQRRSEEWLQENYDLTLISYEVMSRLFKAEGRTMRLSDLAEQVVLTRSGLTRAVDRLEVEDLVSREACPGDRRGVLATLTARGHDLIAPVIVEYERHLSSVVFAELNDDELDTLGALLARLR